MNNFELAKKYFLDGCIFLEAEDFFNAEFKFIKSLELIPNRASTLTNLSIAQLKLKKYSEARESAEHAISVEEGNSEAFLNLGLIEKESKNLKLAIKFFNKAISCKPDYYEAWSNKGNALYELKHYDDAISHYNKALILQPSYAEAWLNKGIVLQKIAHAFDARVCFEKALELNPSFHKARWAKLFTLIPIIFSGNENIQELREMFSCELEQLDEFFSEENIYKAYEIIGTYLPFHLAYQELNNKDILKKYGQVCCRLMSECQKDYNLQHSTARENKRIRLGIVGEQIRNHSVWNAITKGLVFNLDASKFEIHIFYLGGTIDEETNSARMRAASFTDNQSSLAAWTKVIFEKNIDILLYPEIGMDPVTTQLACLRLAPIQIASWGHPETTGLPTIDYYLSAELFEDESSENSYTETLVKLPNLGCHYSRLPITASKFDFIGSGISPDELILICPGMPFKYAPQCDWIWVEIIKRLGRGKLIFFTYDEKLTINLRARLERAFNEANLVFTDCVVFIPWQKPEEFYALMKCADVMLDTVGFSGFNTAMQAVDCAVPIITKQGKFMRGRLASGILKRMQIPELIANSDEAYLELVIRLVEDNLYRKQIVEKMIAMRGVLYDDMEPIYAFENFVLSKTRH